MINNQTIDETLTDETLLPNDELANTEETGEDNQAQSVDSPDTLTAETDEATEPQKEVDQPQEEEQKPQEEIDKELQAKQEQNLKREAGKISSLEKDRNRLQDEITAYKLKDRLTSGNETDQLSALTELTLDRRLFERTKPFLTQQFPELAEINHNEFKTRVEQNYRNDEKLSVNEVVKFEKQKLEKEYRDDLEKTKFLTKLDIELQVKIPEYAKQVEENEELAQANFNYALKVASFEGELLETKLQRKLSIPEIKKLVENTLLRIPEFANTKQSNQSISSRNEIQKGVNSILKGATTNQSNPTKLDSVLASASAEVKATYLEEVKRLVEKKGYTQQEAHKETIDWLKSINRI